MLNLGFLGFASPWMLLALLSLPLLWYLLRVTPPAPRRQVFPAVRLLLGLRPSEETPARTPWWLLLLRLGIAALIILALAQPILNPAAPWRGGGPLVLVVDDGWASARDWELRMEAANGLIDQAERLDRDVLLLRTAPISPSSGTGNAAAAGGEQDPRPQAPALVRQQIEQLRPMPWPVNRQALVGLLDGVHLEAAAQVYWLSDGLAGEGTPRFVERLRRLGPITMLSGSPEDLPKLLLPPESAGAEPLRSEE